MNTEYNGVAYWRMFEPARWLNMSFKDVSVTYFPNEDLIGHAKPVEEWELMAKTHDLIVTARVADEQALTTLLVMREIAQKPIIMEMDDDWSSVSPKNVAYKDWQPGSQAYRLAEEQTRLADIFQLSTHPLKKAMGYKYPKPTWISPNLVDVRKFEIAKLEFEKEKKERSEIRVGWAGGANHYGDFLEVLPALKEIQDKYKNVRLVFCGMRADYFTEQNGGWVSSPEGGKNITYMKKSPLDLSRVEVHDGVNFWKWPSKLASLDLDIVIVPLEDIKFNYAKSNARYLEFSALGVPGVYADVYPYQRTITHGKNGFLASRRSDWVEHISNLIEREDLRREIAEKAHSHVLDCYSFQNNIGIWKKNYEEILTHVSTSRFKSYYKDESCQIPLAG